MLDNRDQIRYARQIAIEEIGSEGQERLKTGRVSIVGGGGLGSAVGIYLTAAGCGHLTIIDSDRIERSNLNRQVLYTEDDLGKKKADVAKTALASLNQDVNIHSKAIAITEDNVIELLTGADVIVDCLDNFATRYLLNQASISLDVPLIHGACSELRGQLMTIVPRATPCLQCVFPQPPPPQPTPILGSIAGTIGTLQATEAIKLLIGLSPLLTGKLVIYDGQHYTWDMVQVERDERCPQCGAYP